VKYAICVGGGTFDHFHPGHERLLSTMMLVSDKVSIGLVSDSFLDKLKDRKICPDLIQPYSQRCSSVESFFSSNNFTDFEIRSLNDPYGQAVEYDSADVIVVTPETKITAYNINEERKKQGLIPLTIVTISRLRDEEGKIISSSRIRKRLSN
jgi:pantetheine-phosphate adenylyltransferase